LTLETEDRHEPLTAPEVHPRLVKCKVFPISGKLTDVFRRMEILMAIAAQRVWTAASLSSLDRTLATVASACAERGIATRLVRSSSEDHAVIVGCQDLLGIVDDPGNSSLRRMLPAGQSAAAVAFIVPRDHSEFIESLSTLSRYIGTIAAPLGAVALIGGMRDVIAPEGQLYGAEFACETIGGSTKIAIIAMQSIRTRFPLDFSSQAVKPAKTDADSLARRAEWFRRRTEPRS
jgi:hypothetical protein